MTQTVGARSLGEEDEGAAGKKKRGAAWLVMLGLLVVLGLIAFLVARNSGDEGDTDGVDLSNDRQGGATENTNAASNAVDDAANAAKGVATTIRDGAGNAVDSATNAANNATGGSTTTASRAGSATTAAPSAPAAPAASGVALTAGSDDVLALAGTNQLAGVTGRAVQGRGVAVESVVADEGFWVGDSPAQRVFVFMTPQARTSAGESPFQVEAGQLVDLSGAMKAGPDAAALGVDEADGAAQLTAQGQYVEATSLSLAQ